MTPVATGDVQRLDTSERESVYLLPVSGGAYVRLSAGALHLLRAIESGMTFDELAATAHRGDGGPVSPAELEATYATIRDRIAQTESQADTLAGGFWLRLRLLPASVVGRLAAVGQLAYHPTAAALLLLLIGIGGAVALAIGAPPPGSLSGAFWPGYLLFLASLLVHEMGHASACARFGARPGEIGFLLYLVYPAFYSNVGAAWSLKRWQRVVVDLGGVYFELAFGALCAFAYAATGWQPLRTTLALIAASCLLSLNPVFKFDGYWVVADSLGVTNLGRQPALLAGRWLQRLRGRPVEPLPWPGPVVTMLAAYAVVSVAMLVSFVAALLPLIAGIVRRYPGLLSDVGRSLGQLAWPARLGELLTASYILLFALMLSLRLIRPLVRSLLRRGYWTIVEVKS